MTNVLILGAGGNIAGKVIDLLSGDPDVSLTLFVRHPVKLRHRAAGTMRITEGDVLKLDDLTKAMAGIDIVYANLAGELERMAKNIVQVMKETNVRRLIFISSIGIYEQPLRPVLKPYRKAADVIEATDLEYTILRPTWFTSADEVDYEITRKGEPEKGSVVSQKSVAAVIVSIIRAPEKYVRESIGVNKPNS